MVSGLAGTGKTTTLVAVVEALKEAGFKPAVCTPTGKAAHVINQKQSGFIATTLHRVLTARPIDKHAQVHSRLDDLSMAEQARELTPEEKTEQQELLVQLDTHTTNRLKFQPVDIESFLTKYDVLVFDEASMIGRETYDELISRIPVPKLFFGDAAQLPPVQDKPAVDLKGAHVRLIDIMRQDPSSGILPVSHFIQRKGDYPKLKEIAQYSDITVRKDFAPEMVKGFEHEHQILCWKNVTRHTVSRMIREARNVPVDAAFPYLPAIGEQFMIDENDDEKRLLKGQLLTMQKIIMFRPNANPFMATVKATDESGNERNLTIGLTDLVEGYGVDLNVSQNTVLNNIRWAERNAIKVMFPYCLTVHKAQGSEWDKVLYLAEMPQGNPEWRKHAYTAVTRAAKEVVICDYAFRFDKTG